MSEEVFATFYLSNIADDLQDMYCEVIVLVVALNKGFRNIPISRRIFILLIITNSLQIVKWNTAYKLEHVHNLINLDLQADN